jgi:hypothetical protein
VNGSTTRGLNDKSNINPLYVNASALRANYVLQSGL